MKRSEDLDLQAEPLQLIIFERTHEVGAEADLDSGVPSDLYSGHAGVEHLAVLGLRDRGEPHLGPAAVHGVVGHQGRYEEGVLIGH